jgi:hypothetical protein
LGFYGLFWVCMGDVIRKVPIVSVWSVFTGSLECNPQVHFFLFALINWIAAPLILELYLR